MTINFQSTKLDFLFNKAIKAQQKFTFQGRRYKYFVHGYNTTWRNERAVEIPIVWRLVKEDNAKNILEVGNVLSHYFPVKHDILDKYEKQTGVINKDVVTYKTKKKYNLIVSISTLEHAGWNKSHKNPRKILLAIENLTKLLKSSGKAVVTLPLGYNSFVDKFLSKNKIKYTEIGFLKRISKDNIWKEKDWDGIKKAKYSKPYPNANAIAVVTFVKQ